MPAAKTATPSLRIEAGLQEALGTAAEPEHRSLANMVEVMLRE